MDRHSHAEISRRLKARDYELDMNLKRKKESSGCISVRMKRRIYGISIAPAACLADPDTNYESILFHGRFTCPHVLYHPPPVGFTSSYIYLKKKKKVLITPVNWLFDNPQRLQLNLWLYLSK